MFLEELKAALFPRSKEIWTYKEWIAGQLPSVYIRFENLSKSEVSLESGSLEIDAIKSILDGRFHSIPCDEFKVKTYFN